VIQYLTLEQLIELHEILLAEFGGVSGIRDLGGLESALMRPQSGYYKDLEQQAAALMESLSGNHPFIDGNKRVAFFATDTFLRMNGFRIECDGEEAHAFLISLYERNAFRLVELEPWLRRHIRTL